MITRHAVEDEARTWLGTPYHSNARLRGIGVDCAQLPIAVFNALGVIPKLDPEYVADWHLHRSEEKYVEWVLRYAREIKREEVGQGDLVLWKFGRTYSHGGIVTIWPEVIHAWIGRGVELGNAARDSDLLDRPARYFTVFE
jgi:cell wall-associated NlpC family hydrolase